MSEHETPQPGATPSQAPPHSSPAPQPSAQPAFPRWAAPALLAVMLMQLGLTWVQGRQLERQHAALVDLRDGLQNLEEVIDDATAPQESGDGWEGLPTRGPVRRKPLRRASIRLQETEEPPRSDADPGDRAARELKESRESAQKAVEKAREDQRKLSVSEAARKAEEKAKEDAARSQWTRYAGLGLALAFVAILVRAWLRRRG